MQIILYLSVVIICYYIGKYYSDKEKERIVFFSELLDFLEFFHKEILKHKNTQIIFSEYRGRDENKIIRVKSKEELISLLKRKNYNNDKNTVNEVITFLENFGKSNSYEKEEMTCAETLEKVKKIYEKSIPDSLKKKELYKKLGIVFGITICVIIM